MERSTKNKTEFINIPVDKDFKQAVEDAAWRQKLRVSEYVRRLIKNDLNPEPST